MVFTKLEHTRRDMYQGLRVSKTSLRIGREAHRLIGSPSRVSVYYDLDAKQIKLEADPKGKRVTDNRGAGTVRVDIAKYMPIGKYMLLKDNIFEYVRD